MKPLDFEFDNHRLSDFGYMICIFGSNSGVETISNSSQLVFNTVFTLNNNKYNLLTTNHENYLETTFQICKKENIYNPTPISLDELRYISRWLNRKSFHKFKIIDSERNNFYYEGSFNISKIEFNNQIYGLELNFISNHPYALREEVTLKQRINKNSLISISNLSDDEGYLYPEISIELLESGDLSLINLNENRTTYIRNCTKGEIITLNYPLISSSLNAHKIQNDFNYVFFRLINSFKSSLNQIKSSLNINLTVKYSPNAKIGL